MNTARNTRHLATCFAAAALLAAGAAQAGSLKAGGPQNMPAAQSLIPAKLVYATAQPNLDKPTREQVKAELVAARARGELSTVADNEGTLLEGEFVPTATREQVKTEMALARVDGDLNTASDNQPVDKVFYVPNKTRAEVQAETIGLVGQGAALSRGDKAEYVAQP